MMQTRSCCGTVWFHDAKMLLSQGLYHVMKSGKGTLCYNSLPLVEPSGQTGIVCRFQDAV